MINTEMERDSPKMEENRGGMTEVLHAKNGDRRRGGVKCETAEIR